MATSQVRPGTRTNDALRCLRFYFAQFVFPILLVSGLAGSVSSEQSDPAKREAAYRANLTTHLRKQIETLESGRAEPVEVPDVVRELKVSESTSNGINTPQQGERGAADQPQRREGAPSYSGSSGSNTPRLDALLGDQR